jgi:hypothetical protein
VVVPLLGLVVDVEPDGEVVVVVEGATVLVADVEVVVDELVVVAGAAVRRKTVTASPAIA